jgi:hypothetical protein
MTTDPTPALNLTARIGLRGPNRLTIDVYVNDNDAGCLWVPVEYAPQVLGIINAGTDLVEASKRFLKAFDREAVTRPCQLSEFLCQAATEMEAVLAKCRGETP